MVTNVTESQRLKNNKKTSNTNEMLFNTFSNLRCIMVQLVLCKDALFT